MRSYKILSHKNLDLHARFAIMRAPVRLVIKQPVHIPCSTAPQAGGFNHKEM
jgi:hypothetical protein